jgi:hypothetical protein
MCNSISYEGLKEDIHLSEDSTGSSQTCCVREGWQNPDAAVEEDADEPPAPSPEEQMRWMDEMMKKEAKEKSKKKTKRKAKVKVNIKAKAKAKAKKKK